MGEPFASEGHTQTNSPFYLLSFTTLAMEFPSPPSRKERVSVPEGQHVKTCLCGTSCRLLESTELGYTYNRRYWMCANYEFDPP